MIGSCGVLACLWCVNNGLLVHCLPMRVTVVLTDCPVNAVLLLVVQVFFKAGVLGTLEDWRDERLARIITLFQAHIRGSILRKSYQKLCDQRYGAAPRSLDSSLIASRVIFINYWQTLVHLH